MLPHFSTDQLNKEDLLSLAGDVALDNHHIKHSLKMGRTFLKDNFLRIRPSNSAAYGERRSPGKYSAFVYSNISRLDTSQSLPHARTRTVAWENVHIGFNAKISLS